MGSMFRMLEQDIVPLPMHDGIMVASPHASTAKRILEETSFEIAGVLLPVKMTFIR